MYDDSPCVGLTQLQVDEWILDSLVEQTVLVAYVETPPVLDVGVFFDFLPNPSGMSYQLILYCLENVMNTLCSYDNIQRLLVVDARRSSTSRPSSCSRR